MIETEIGARRLSTDASWNGRTRLVEADARPGRYYVTARDGGRTAFLLGPFVQPSWGKEAHARALGEVRRARRFCSENFARADFFAYGTAWTPLTGPAVVGRLNGLIGGGK